MLESQAHLTEGAELAKAASRREVLEAEPNRARQLLSWLSPFA